MGQEPTIIGTHKDIHSVAIGTVSFSLLKGNRSRYRNLLDKELVKGKHLLEDGEGEIKFLNQKVNNCINRLNDWSTKA